VPAGNPMRPNDEAEARGGRDQERRRRRPAGRQSQQESPSASRAPRPRPSTPRESAPGPATSRRRARAPVGAARLSRGGGPRRERPRVARRTTSPVAPRETRRAPSRPGSPRHRRDAASGQHAGGGEPGSRRPGPEGGRQLARAARAAIHTASAAERPVMRAAAGVQRKRNHVRAAEGAPRTRSCSTAAIASSNAARVSGRALAFDAEVRPPTPRREA